MEKGLCTGMMAVKEDHGGYCVCAMNKLWFTSDWHYNHDMVIEYSQRPFNRVSAMNRTLVANYKKCVGEEDICYFLGDLCLIGPANWRYIESVVKGLPGHKILILGNHDKLDPFTYVEIGFESVHTSLVLPEYNIGLIHDPAMALVDPNLTWLVGHVHTLFKQIKDPNRKGSIINVCVEQWEYFPVELNALRQLDDNIKGE
jgi:calcineurin-like phosphoesterase family protein